MQVSAQAHQKMASVSVLVTRCGCDDAQKARPDWHGRHGQVCPRPRSTEDHGTVAYWHRNPVRVLLWRLGRWLRGRSAGTVRVK
jgi:hypothetical protein